MPDETLRRVAVMSDIHGNVTALKKALEVIHHHGCEALYFLGDAVGYLTNPEALRLLLTVNNLIAIQGNHEAFLLGLQEYDEKKENIYQINQTQRFLHPDLVSAIESWPNQRETKIFGHKTLFIHGSPSDPTNGYVYPDTELHEIDYDFVFMGNTHRPFVRQVGHTTYVNVGSVGLPRDDGRYGAFCLWDVDLRLPEILRFKIDLSSEFKAQTSTVHPSIVRLSERRERDTSLIGRIIDDV